MRLSGGSELLSGCGDDVILLFWSGVEQSRHDTVFMPRFFSQNMTRIWSTVARVVASLPVP